MDYFKLKNENGEGIRVEFTDDVAVIVDSNFDSADYILSVIDDLSDEWIMNFRCSFHATSN